MEGVHGRRMNGVLNALLAHEGLCFKCPQLCVAVDRGTDVLKEAGVRGGMNSVCVCLGVDHSQFILQNI